MIRSLFIALFAIAATNAQAGTYTENAIWALKSVLPIGNYIGTVPGTTKYCSISIHNIKGNNLREFSPTVRFSGTVTSPWNNYFAIDRATGVAVPGLAIDAGAFEVNTTFYSVSGFKMGKGSLVLTASTIPSASPIGGAIWPATTTVTVTENNDGTLTVKTDEMKFDPHSNWTSTRSFACAFPF